MMKLPAIALFGLFLASGQGAPLDDLKAWLAKPRDERPPLEEQGFAELALDAAVATQAAELLWQDHAAMVKATRAAEHEQNKVVVGERSLRYLAKTFGDAPESGRSLFISMHGGGGAPARVNDQQWRNQIRLYQPEEGIYLAPRAPTDTWNLWHQAHIDPLFDRLIENMIVFEGVNPDRVYLMGYSAGGDGVYQLAPRMSDRFAAVAMMAGHPNETDAIGLRNVPFALQVGERDAAYKRNAIAAKWGEKLAELHKADPGGYEHLYRLHAGKPHWMDLEDKIAVPWMAKFDRRRLPGKIVWKQDDVTHARSYWLALPPDQIAARQLIVASRDGQSITIESADKVASLKVLFNDDMLDLDRPLKVVAGEKVLFEGKPTRRIATIARTLRERADPRMVFSAEVTVDLK